MPDPRIVFLMYHELELPGRPLVQSEPGYVRYILSQQSFSSQLSWLKSNGWSGLSVTEALGFPAQKAVAITFDDGCETDLLTAAPLLHNAAFHATFYVTAGRLNQRGYLSSTQLRELSNIFEIGCHSMTHAYLNDLGANELRTEIVDAGSRLEDIIGKKIEHFSCPGGRYDARTLALAKEAGYRSVATSRTDANSPSTDPFQLGRVAIMRNMNLSTFSTICDGSSLWKIRLNETMRQSARKLLGNKLYDRFRQAVLPKSPPQS